MSLVIKEIKGENTVSALVYYPSGLEHIAESYFNEFHEKNPSRGMRFRAIYSLHELKGIDISLYKYLVYLQASFLYHDTPEEIKAFCTQNGIEFISVKK